jgi:hypothetical protein
MAYFAKLNENNVVIEVNAVSNEVINNLPFPDSEPLGIEFLTTLLGYSNWKQTSYNSSFRKNYAGIDFTYDSQRDAFITPKPYPSWVLNENMCQYEAPVPYPDDGRYYRWDEATLNWKEIK